MLPLIASNQAFAKDVGLIITFVGIGIIVNIIVVIILAQVRGEHQQNRKRVADRRGP
jgi:hypothetical protein